MLHRRLSVFVVSLLTVPAAAQSFGRPLTPEEVACEERQLERLNHRFWVGLVGSTLLVWRGSPAGGIYHGLASTGEIGPDAQGQPARRESQLAFDLLLKAGEDFLNPGRPPLPQATLVRRDMATNLSTSPGVPHFLLDLTFDLAPEVPDPSRPRQPIGITNRPTAAEAADGGAGRGLLYDDLLTPCHGDVSEFDLRMLAILARTVRPSQCLLEPFPNCDSGFDRYKAVLFRGAEPLTYRMNVYPYLFTGEVDARVAFLLRLQVDDGGRLVAGDVQALPWCASPDDRGCTFFFNPNFALFVLPPLRPGFDRHGAAEFARAARLNIEYDGSPFNVLHDTVDWADLLRDTAWNEGLTGTGTRAVQSSSGAPP
jgi:hypothetical protein